MLCPSDGWFCTEHVPSIMALSMVPACSHPSLAAGQLQVQGAGSLCRSPTCRVSSDHMSGASDAGPEWDVVTSQSVTYTTGHTDAAESIGGQDPRQQLLSRFLNVQCTLTSLSAGSHCTEVHHALPQVSPRMGQARRLSLCLQAEVRVCPVWKGP